MLPQEILGFIQGVLTMAHMSLSMLAALKQWDSLLRCWLRGLMSITTIIAFI